MSTYLIGDIQGCLKPLQTMLDKVQFDPAKDRLWSCGDLVNRGGDSLQVLRLLHEMGPAVDVTLGNHDLQLLASWHRKKGPKSKNREFKAIFRADDGEELIHWLQQFPLARWSEEHRLLRVHAGVVPSWDLEQTLSLAAEVEAIMHSEQRRKFYRRMYGKGPVRWRDDRRGWGRIRLITSILTRIRFCEANDRCNFRMNGPPASARKGQKPWFRHKNRQTRDIRIAFGHWAALGLKVKKRYLALDSGCVWGGKLTAYRLEDGEVFQVYGLD